MNSPIKGTARILFDERGWNLVTLIDSESISYSLPNFRHPLNEALTILWPTYDCDLRPFPGGGWRGYLTDFRKDRDIVNPEWGKREARV